MKLLECGQIVSTHGVKGEIRINPWCDSPEFLLELKQLYLKDGTTLPIQSARVHKNCVNVVSGEIRNIDEAMPYINQVVYLDRDEIELPQGSYFIADLMGISVEDIDTGVCYGKIVDVFRTGANDVYTIRSDAGKDVLIPVINDVVISTDIVNKTMKIRPLKGLFDE